MKREHTTHELYIQSLTIDWIRFPLIILVIVHHVEDRIIPQLSNFNLFDIDLLHFTGDDFYHILRMLFDTIKGICNPGFFLIAGYLFFLNVKTWDKGEYIGKLKKRLYTLLIPYILWNIIEILSKPILIICRRLYSGNFDWQCIPDYFQKIHDKGVLSIFWNYYTWGETRVNILGWSTPSFGPISSPMWFLQTLICLSIITPLIYLVVRYLKIWGIIVLGLLYFTGIWFSVPGFGISSIFFFTLGAYFGINKKNMVFEFRRLKFLIFPLSAITLIISIIFKYGAIVRYNYAVGLFTLTATLSLVIIGSYWVERAKYKPNKPLTQAVFFIYASHSSLLVLFGVGIIYSLITLQSQVWYILTIGYFIVPIATAYLCFLGYLILKKIMPPVAKILAGNR